MEVFEAIESRRSIRKYKQQPVEREMLEKMIGAARLAAQGTNQQPMKYCIVDDPQKVAEINKDTKWGMLIYPQAMPKPDELPPAYIIVLTDTRIKKDADVDAGSAVANMLLAAQALGLGTCWLGSISRKQIAQTINMPDYFVVHTAVAVGYAAEDPVYEDAKDSIAYYKDESGRLHVPKRKLEDIIFHNEI
jgi:nitroreductase